MTAKREHDSVCIVGIGACTALGADLPASAAAVRAAISGFADHPYMIDKAGDPMVVARALFVPEDLTAANRLAHIAAEAAKEALAPFTGSGKRLQKLPTVVGLPPDRPGRNGGLEGVFTQRFQAELTEVAQLAPLRTLSSGHAAGIDALAQAWRMIRSGDLDLCLVGGVDSYHEPETLEWLDELEQLHSDANKWGFIPGEGAGFVLLSSSQFAQQNKLEPLGYVLAAAVTREKNLIKTDTVCVGEGLSEAVAQVLQLLPSQDRTVHQTICDMNGERYRADEFGYTLVRTNEHYADPGEFVAPADCWGDVGAASAPLFIGLAVTAGRKGYAEGPNTLIWASSERGERGAALIRVETEPREV
ncbi:MAG: beta-ketoacyl synthase N-terminal-like domain-containing protein [Candidatus Zixiibacteriota bacterium]